MKNTQKNIDKYLSKTTRGLWGQKRADVKEELAADLQERIGKHRIAGLNHDAAVEASLQELGKASYVNRGMMQLYTLPPALGLGTLVAVVVSLWFVTFSGSVAQTVSGTFNYPSEACLIKEDCLSFGQLFIEKTHLREAFEKHGINVFYKDKNYTDISFPNEQAITVFHPSNLVTMGGETVEKSDNYISLSSLIDALSKERPNTLITFEGWEVPVVTVDDVTLEIKATDNPAVGTAFYTSLLEGLVTNDIHQNTISFSMSKPDEVAANWQTNRAEKDLILNVQDGIYGFISLSDIENGVEKTYFLDAAVAENGKLRLEAPVLSQKLDFVSDIAHLGTIGQTIVVKFGSGVNGSWYQILSPDSFSQN